MSKLLLAFFESISALHEWCVQWSNVLIEPVNECTLPTHIFQYLLSVLPF